MSWRGKPYKPPVQLPGDPPPSRDETDNVDEGPCNLFSPMDPPWQARCRNCGYGHS